MNKALEQKTKEWMQLERMTLEQRRKAAEFYDKELMHLVAEAYVENNKKKIREQVKYLAVTVGTSHEPIVLNLRLLKPEKVYFIYTEKSAEVMNRVIRDSELSPESYEKQKVDEVDPLNIYRAFLDMYLAWNQPTGLVIDFTGGTKTMSATAALAGAMMHAQMVYVATVDYLEDFRKPRPGSERLVYIDDPLAVFGELEFSKAIGLFGRKNYAGAASQLAQLKERIPDPNLRQQMNFAWLLAKAYEAYDSLDLEEAWPYMVRLNMELQRDRRIHPGFLLMEQAEHLSEQEKVFEELAKIPPLMREGKQMQVLKTSKLIHTLMFAMYQNAANRKTQEKYDMATLLYYRLLEMISQRRLARYNLNVSQMDYLAISTQNVRNQTLKGMEPKERLTYMKQQALEIRGKLFHKNVSDYLPTQAALLDSFLILTILEDGIMEAKNGKGSGGVELLKRIRSMVLLRNQSIFAHGLGPVEKEKFLKFEEFVTFVFRKFCELEKVSFEQMTACMKEIDPAKSANYSFGRKGNGGYLC